MELQTMKKASIWRRVAAFYVDAIIISLVVSALLFSNFTTFTENPERLFSFFNAMMFASIVGICIKDIINGVSLGKWIFSIQVRDSNDPTSKPSIIRLVCRNLLTIAWPVEVIALLVSKNKRKIGDAWTKTDVYSVTDRIKILRIIITAVLMIVLFITFTLFTTMNVIKNDTSYEQAINSIEQNSEIQILTGGITGYGIFPIGSVSTTDGNGEAEFTVTVKGKQKNLKVYVYLEKEPKSDWKVKEISY